MNPSKSSPTKSSPSKSGIDETRRVIETFFTTSREPVLIEPGEEPLVLRTGNFVLESRAGRLTLQAWDDDHNLVRRITAIASVQPGRVEAATQRFGKRPGALLLVDRQAARNHDIGRRATRLQYRELFRRSLRRQFPDWTIAVLTTEPDLEHSLTPAYPRALLRKGVTGWAAIGAPPLSDVAGALTFGLIWLSYLRSRERRLSIEGLALFLPAGHERVTALRLRCLNTKAAQYALFVQSGDRFEDRIDLADYGNVSSTLLPATRPSPAQPAGIDAWVDRICRSAPHVERVPRNDGSTSLRVRGLEFARATAENLVFGLETFRPATESHLREIVCLAGEIDCLRSPDARSDHALYSRNPEGWLESVVRANLREVDATLLPAPVYGQVPAFTAAERDILDLLAVDRRGRLAVIELKVSEDIHLPLQALDYWMRVNRHATAGEFGPHGYFPGIELRREPPRLLLIGPALGFHSSNELVLRYLPSDIGVERIGVGIEWRKQLKVMFRY